MTVAELMRYYNTGFQINCELIILKMGNWDETFYFEDTGLPWAFPSPNMPTVETAIVYPGQVLLEGTNLSRGSWNYQTI